MADTFAALTSDPAWWRPINGRRGGAEERNMVDVNKGGPMIRSGPVALVETQVARLTNVLG
jgi:hypothetical protein